MTNSTTSTRPTRAALRSSRCRTVLVAIAAAAGLFAVPTVAGASSRPVLTAARVEPYLAGSTSSTCNKVSAAQVSAVFGSTVPAPTSFTINLKKTYTIPGDPLKRVLPLKFKLSAVTTTCTFGNTTSLASLAKSVGLSVEVLSMVPSAREFHYLVSLAAAANLAMTPYPGLAEPAYYVSFNEAGVTAQGILLDHGRTLFGAFVYTRTAPKSELVSLVQLAQKL